MRVVRRPIEVLAGGVAAPVTGRVTPIGHLELDVALTECGRGVRPHLAGGHTGAATARLPRIGVRLSVEVVSVLEHGWQSWSPVRVCRTDDVRPDRLRAPRWRRVMYHADPALAGRAVCGDQFLLDDGGITGFLGGDTHFGTVATDAGGGATAWALLDGAELQPDEQRHLHPLWFADGDPLDCYDEFTRHWSTATQPRTGGRAPLG